MIGAFLSGIWAKVAMVGAALAAAAGAFAVARRGGVQSQQNADLKDQVHDNAKANEARAEVDRLGPGGADAELRKDWNRG